MMQVIFVLNNRKKDEFDCFAKDFFEQNCLFLLDIYPHQKANKFYVGFVIVKRTFISRPLTNFTRCLINIYKQKARVVYLTDPYANGVNGL